MKWFRRIFIALVLLLAIAAALPFLVPLDGYLPQIEKQASSALGQPVTINGIRLVVLPRPHVTLNGIAVGKNDDIRLGKVRVTPDLLSLLGSSSVIHSIELDGLVLTQRGAEGIAALARQNPAGTAQPPAFRVEAVRLSNARIEFGKLRFGPFGGLVRFNSGGTPERATLVTRDGRLKASIRFDKARYLIEARAQAWTLPLGPPIRFDQLSIKATATDDGADFSAVNASLYEGTVSGGASIDWRSGVQLKGMFDIQHLELLHVVPLVSPGTRVSGKLNARPAFSAAAASAELLARALQLETQFDVKQGVIYGVDIERAASSMTKQQKSDGETRFDHLSGHLAMAHGSYRFTQLKITSGELAVDGGEVGISPQKKLSGRINVQVKSLHAGVPLTVAGTVDTPLLYPSGGTMTGAAIGTMILGPGVGTSVGAKVGGYIEGLFGKKKEEKTKK